MDWEGLESKEEINQNVRCNKIHPTPQFRTYLLMLWAIQPASSRGGQVLTLSPSFAANVEFIVQPDADGDNKEDDSFLSVWQLIYPI